jgi:DNA-binding transcriptional LysR family regulator
MGVAVVEVNRIKWHIFIETVDAHMKVDLDAIEALDCVVELGGVAPAAARLNKVQSAVSYQLRKLEEQLGISIIDRRGYRIRLTPAGEAVLTEGKRLLSQASRLESVAHLFAQGWEPRLTMIVDGILPLQPVFKALRTLAEERVPTRIQVKVAFLGGVQKEFERDRADLMLVKDYAPDTKLVATALPEIECILCVAPSHPLARKRSVGLEDLREHVELSIQDSSGSGDDRHMFGGERVFYLSGFMAKLEALHMCLGFGWMPEYLVKDLLRRRALREVRFSGGSRYRFTPYLVQRTDVKPGRTGERLATLLTSIISL